MDSKERLQRAMEYAMANRPKIGGFPFLAECLRKAGVRHNIWSLPAAQSIYIMSDGNAVVQQGTPVIVGMADVPPFDEEALIMALRTDQAGESTFPEFLNAAWSAGVWGYDVDFERHTVTYMGVKGQLYTESYPVIEVLDSF